MSARSSNDDYRIKPGITVDRKVWEEFKEVAGDNASQTVESFMQAIINSRKSGTPLEILSSAGVNSISLLNATQWTTTYSEGALNLTNTSCCYSAGTTSMDPKDIIIK